MACEFRVRINGKGCKHYSSGYCDLEKTPYYRCIDYIASGKLMLSHSQKQSWERCPYKWYLEQIRGIEVVSATRSPALKMGSEFGRLISGVGKPEIFTKDEWFESQLVKLMAHFVKDYELLPDDVEWEVDCTRDGYRGILDMVQTHKKQFGELKFTTDPSRYTSKPSATAQLTSYFYLRPDLQEAIMLPVQVSKLKDKRKKDEEPDKKLKRVAIDVRKRMKFYFPGYDPEKEQPKWGTRFSIREFDLEDFDRELAWVRGEIQRSAAAGYFPQRSANCDAPFKCDFYPVYMSGGVNWQLFRSKKKARLEEKEAEEKEEQDGE